eukprot:7759504-Prorocentrum_lima.AAC.1
MTSSLVGSEMCIRDRNRATKRAMANTAMRQMSEERKLEVVARYIAEPVSYTHLTLPTICSV